MPSCPKDVKRYVKEMQEEDPSMSDDKAWAVAWSRFCEYKDPSSEHCKQDSYFSGRKQADMNKTANPFSDDGSGPFEYDRLADAAVVTRDARYGSGRTQVWYAKQTAFRELIMGSEFAMKRGVLPDPFTLSESHVYLGNVNETNPSKVFYMMQGEVWSPEGEAATFPAVRQCGHTSMSVGDVVVIGSEVLMVDRHGFFDLTTETKRTASAQRVAARAMAGALKTARSSQPTTKTQDEKNREKNKVKGKLPPPRNDHAKALAELGTGGTSTHKNRTKNVEDGRSRKEKHKKDPRDKEAAEASPLRVVRDYGAKQEEGKNT